MTRQRSTSASSIRFNGQVYFVPMTNWHLAAWTAARSTRPVVSEQRDNPMDLEAFADSYATHTFAPMLWYTPGAALSDEVYDFLHRLPYIQRIVVLTERRGEGFRNDLVDNQNLQAMLDDLFEQSERARAGVQRGEKQALPSLSREDMGPIFLPLFEDVDQVSASGWTSGDRWLRLHTSLSGKGPAPPYRLPHIAIVVPETPQVACAVVPLAAHVQGTVLYMDPEHTIHEDLIQRLVCAVFGPDAVDEIWLVGKASQLQENLEQEIDQVRRALLSDAAGARGRGPDLPEQIIAALRQQPNRIGQVPTVRIIRGDGHFAVSEQAAVLLLTYRYLDHVLTQAVKHPQGRECFFQFLASQGMRGLFHHCNGILDLADQLRQKNFLALADLHHVYWSMSDAERRAFIRCFQEHFRHEPVVSDAMAVIADCTADESVPHHLIDAAAYAARRAAPLLLLQPLPSETSYYIGSLMDKIDERLKKFSDLQIKLITERQKLYQAPTDEPGQASRETPATRHDSPRLDAAYQRWQERKRHIENLQRQMPQAQRDLRYYIYKTGEVLYESLVPLAMRNTLHHLRPCFLAVFIQDPSLPIELVRETDASETVPMADGDHRPVCLDAVGVEDSKLDRDLYRFWSLRYAIGHMSSVNFYETNLTNNISFFTPPVGIDLDNVRVLLCSNPTSDLFFSGQEAKKIAKRFESGDRANRDRQGELDELAAGDVVMPKKLMHLRLDSEQPGTRPTRDNFIAALRKGHDIVHYSGHAFFDNVLPGRSGLVLNDGVLTASDVRFMLDLSSSPIIYANACLAGRIKSVSSRFTGLAAAFIRAGAAGYVSPVWSIDDQDAAALALVYYDKLLQEHLPIGQCLQAAKWVQARSDSITWASYVLYGDPVLRIIRAEGEASYPSEEVSK